MINKLVYAKNPIFWVGFHILLGVVSTATPWILIFWYYLVLIFSLDSLTRKEAFNYQLSFLITYLVSFEIFARIVGTSPYISYEQSKYITFLLCSIGILNGYAKGKMGIWLVVVLIPGLLIDLSGQVTYPYLIFDLLGPINLGLSVWFFGLQRFTPSGFLSLLRLLVYPIISALFFTFIKTPDLDTIEFELGANFETTGGFGSNQVSVLFGLGIFLMFLFIIFKWRFTNNFWLDSFLLLGFAFQGFLSFSRGGIIGGVVGIIAVIFILKKLGKKKEILQNIPKIGKYVIPSIFILIVTFYLVNEITDGLLLMRYRGETSGTLAGAKERSIDTFTSSRTAIAKEDFELFAENPFLGTGAASSRYLRVEHRGTSPHIELSRLFAEHGLLGIVYILVVGMLVRDVYRRKGNIIVKSVLFGFAILAIYTTFHSATRTYITPLLFGLAMINVRPIKKRKLTPEIEESQQEKKVKFPIAKPSPWKKLS